MFECPSCGGELRFDIASQQMLCPYCNSSYDPKTVEKGHDAEEQEAFEQDGFEQGAQGSQDADTFDATIFTCPQCGGEILSMDNEATSFCSFCGASTILSSRLSHEKKPDYIIPFKVTKEECQSAYSKLMKGAFFAPKELKDGSIDKFRAIYMPYWVYDMRQNGNMHLQAKKSYRSGNYQITEDYILSGKVDAYYKGISFDASSSFADNISENIAPFDVKGMSQFYPAYLAGFYADTADVEESLYRSDAEDLANNATIDQIKEEPLFKDKTIKMPNDEQASRLLCTNCKKVDRAMFPVWFLSYRKGDRVAYATVNGQTGKVASDLPVDIKKYLLGSLVLAIPLFILLNLFANISPVFVMLATAIIALVAMFIHVHEIKEIGRTELQLDNKGYLSKAGVRKDMDALAFGKEKKKASVKAAKNNLASKIVILYMVLIFGFPFISVIGSTLQHSWLYMVIILGISIFPLVRGLTMYTNLPKQYRKPGFMWGFVAILIATMVAIINPVADWFYYAGAVAALAAVLCTMMSIIMGYNILSTRPLPQLNKRGGEEHE
ncbi:MAG: hypothetical protein ACI4DO_00465 [Roseburia sp.]